jgi:hypothetical protein
MISYEEALDFAREWIAAWNTHDLAKIMPYYAEDFALTTPYIVEVMKEPSGAIKGKRAAGCYWTGALRRNPDLHLELVEVFPGVRSMVILYRTIFGRQSAEWLLFGGDGRVRRSVAHYCWDTEALSLQDSSGIRDSSEVQKGAAGARASAGKPSWKAALNRLLQGLLGMREAIRGTDAAPMHSLFAGPRAGANRYERVHRLC